MSSRLALVLLGVAACYRDVSSDAPVMPDAHAPHDAAPDALVPDAANCFFDSLSGAGIALSNWTVVAGGMPQVTTAGTVLSASAGSSAELKLDPENEVIEPNGWVELDIASSAQLGEIDLLAMSRTGPAGLSVGLGDRHPQGTSFDAGGGAMAMSVSSTAAFSAHVRIVFASPTSASAQWATSAVWNTVYPTTTIPDPVDWYIVLTADSAGSASATVANFEMVCNG